VLDEAFALAAFSGRVEVMQWLRGHGADVNGSVHLGLTALHMAVMAQS
jgi:ankyrin repeat protein